jgi:glycosyltransferase involved in cell wall biosynthesis
MSDMMALPIAADRRDPALQERAGGGGDLAVIVLTLNEHRNLPACLDSLGGLKCRVVVVDSGSTDDTVRIAVERGAAVVEHAFENYAAQRNWAQANLPFQTDWVLHLDADERLTPECVGEINAILREPPGNVGGFLFRKRTIFMGRWIRHGGHYPSFHLRLFRRDVGRCEDRLYDQHFLVQGDIRELKSDYIDVVSSDLGSWTLRHVRWSLLEAEEIARGETRSGQVRSCRTGNPIEKRRWLRTSVYGRSPLFFRAAFYWGYRYFFRLGFLDGTEGLIFHFLQGFWFRFLIDARLFEARKRR